MKADRRTQILDAAAALIAGQGFTSTSVDDVIKGAKLSGKSHFYHYFKSKEELGYEVLNRQFERFAERGLAILREPMIDPLERLNLFIDGIVALQAESGGRNGSPFGNLAGELADAHEGFRIRIEAVFERWASQIRSLLWEARPQLRDDVDAVRLARFIIAALEGAVLMTRVKRDITVLEGIAVDLKRFIAMHVKDGLSAPTTTTTTTTTKAPGARRSPRPKAAQNKLAPGAPKGDGTW
ncbi:MAG: TetR family transcriptional regulator C-terminal domain-containing protein [Gemmatimonas sp.]